MSGKRSSKQPNRYGKSATEQAVDVASGKRRSVPGHLASDKKQKMMEKKAATSNRKTAERQLDDKMFESQNRKKIKASVCTC